MSSRIVWIAALTGAVAILPASPNTLAKTESATQGVASAPDYSMAYYDSDLKRVVLLGGMRASKGDDRDRVWSWSGTRWEVVADSGPRNRVNAGVAYDSRRHMAVVTGGSRRRATDSTWEVVADTWEGGSRGWRARTGGDIGPRDHNALVYDESRHVVMMYGGIGANRSGVWPNDTWELRNDGWTRVSTDGPPGRGRTALAADTKRGQIVMFGGVSAPDSTRRQTFFGDTWVWERGRWRKVADSGPRGRYAHAMVFDERAGVVWLYGGAAAHSNAPLSDMWQWDGARWTEIRLTGPTPGYRYQPAMVYDRARGKTVLYGGMDGARDDTWEWDGRQWTEIRSALGASSSPAPTPRNSHAMVSAGPSGGVLLFGGANGGAPRLADTLWSWNGNAWRPMSDPGPHARNLPAAAYDTRRGIVVLYGGAGLGNGNRYGDTWEWNGTRWEEKNVRTPGPRDHHAMAYDDARGRVVVYGGLVGSALVGGTWTYDGSVWTMADSTTGPGPVGHHAMAYDSRRQRIVMYGGAPNNGPRLSDTWEWDGAKWEKSATPTSPGPRSHHRMAYDASRGVVVLYGGGDSTATDTWTYDGRDWKRQDSEGPTPRWSSAMAYDVTRQRVVLFGGGRNARPYDALGDTWEWDGTRWERKR